MIKTAEMHVESLRGYSKPLSKISRMAASGGITPIIKGLYETNKETPVYLLAGSTAARLTYRLDMPYLLPWLDS